MSAYGGARSTALMELTYSTYEPWCHLCTKWIDVNLTGNWGPSVDHVIPRSHGGSDDIDNLRPAHMLCNATRGNKSIEEYRDTVVNELDWLISLSSKS